MPFNSIHSGNKFSLSEPKHEYKSASAKKDLTAERGGNNTMGFRTLKLPKQWHLPSLNGFHFPYSLRLHLYRQKGSEDMYHSIIWSASDKFSHNYNDEDEDDSS